MFSFLLLRPRGCPEFRQTGISDFSEQLTEVSIREDGQVEVTGFLTLGLPW
jgi:hypothetical protein